MKASQLGVDAAAAAARPTRGRLPDAAARPDAEARLEVRNAIGLHARPAALLRRSVVRGYDAEVRVAKEGGGAPVRATSLTNVVALGARFGDTLAGHRVGAAGGRGARRRCARWPTRASATASRAAGGAADPGARRARHPAPAVQAPAGGRRALRRPGLGRRRDRARAPPRRPVRPAARPRRRRAPSASARAWTRRSPPRARRSRTTAQAVAGRAGDAEAAIFDAHLALLDDEALLDPARERSRAARPPSARGTTPPSRSAELYRGARRAAAARARGRRARCRAPGRRRGHGRGGRRADASPASSSPAS